MPDGTLRFVQSPYTSEQISRMRDSFRRRGFCVLPDVFERDSVFGFRARIQLIAQRRVQGGNSPVRRWMIPMDAPELVEPINAPRLRAMLPVVLTPAVSLCVPERQAGFPAPHGRALELSDGSLFHRPLPQVCDAAWLIDDDTEFGAWHRDRWADQSNGEVAYQHPSVVHSALYFQDMTTATAPTQLIPGSHLDPNAGLPPDKTTGRVPVLEVWEAVSDAGGEVADFAVRAQDAILWDQRTLHRRGGFSPANKGERRIVAIHGFAIVDHYPHWPTSETTMPQAMASAWAKAENAEEQVFWGGKWSATSVLKALQSLPLDVRKKLQEGMSRL